MGELGLENRGTAAEDVMDSKETLEGDEGALGAMEALEDGVDHGGGGGEVVSPEG